MCGADLDFIGVRELREGGLPGGLGKAILGSWSDYGEGVIRLEMLSCPECRRVEFRLPKPPM